MEQAPQKNVDPDSGTILDKLYYLAHFPFRCDLATKIF
jgi:hypothetical protein